MRVGLSEQFRIARAEEIPAVARLVSHSFPGPTRTLDWWRERLEDPRYGGGPEILWLGEESGRLVAACQLHSFRQWIGGVAFSCMGLGTVAIAPTRRRRGAAGRLVISSLHQARERGDLVSALYPFRVSFYERLGYGLAGRAFQYRLPPDALAVSEENVRVELAESVEDRGAVQQVYEQWIRGETGQVERTEHLWDRLWEMEDHATVLCRDGEGEVVGYSRVRYRTDLPPAERFLEVEERAWLTPGGQRAIYAWLASLGDQWQQIAYRAHPDEGFEDRLREPRLPWGSAPSWGLWFPSATLLRGPMFRLVNLPAAWTRRPVNQEGEMTLALDVRDEQIPENGGHWRFRLEGGRVTPESSPSGAADVALAADVSTLSRIFIGDLAPSAAVAGEIASVDHPAALPALDRLLRLPRPWTFDRF